MSIENMPEDELDKLFQQAASELHPEFDPKAWQAMEAKLEAHTRLTTKWWRMSSLVLLILLVGISTWVGYTRLSGHRDKTANKDVKEQPITTPEMNKELKQSTITDASGQHPGIEKADADLAKANPKEVGAKVPERIKVAKGKPATPDRLAAKRQITAPATEKNIKTRRTGQAPVSSATVNKAPAATSQRNQELNNKVNVTETKSDETIAVSTDRTKNILPPADSAVQKPDLPKRALPTDSSRIPAAQPVNDSAATKKSKKALAVSRFTFSVLAAPDLSTVGFSNPGGISTNMGLTLGYILTERWSVTTGIMRARKIYDARPDDYGNQSYWNYRHKPDAISAVCQVLDIPINIGYNIWQGDKSGIALNTGLSSYLMKKEKYTYEYYAPNAYKKVWQVANQNQHFFSIYNLSAAYGRQLSPSMLVGVEPFVKVPLAGVGAGKVKLASAGVFFSLSYRYPQ